VLPFSFGAYLVVNLVLLFTSAATIFEAGWQSTELINPGAACGERSRR
jgi:hypothetical protein